MCQITTVATLYAVSIECRTEQDNKGPDVQNPGLPIPRLFFVTYQEHNYKCAAYGGPKVPQKYFCALWPHIYNYFPDKL